jgi:hypothetical protein
MVEMQAAKMADKKGQLLVAERVERRAYLRVA